MALLKILVTLSALAAIAQCKELKKRQVPIIQNPFLSGLGVQQANPYIHCKLILVCLAVQQTPQCIAGSNLIGGCIPTPATQQCSFNTVNCLNTSPTCGTGIGINSLPTQNYGIIGQSGCGSFGQNNVGIVSHTIPNFTPPQIINHIQTKTVPVPHYIQVPQPYPVRQFIDRPYPVVQQVVVEKPVPQVVHTPVYVAYRQIVQQPVYIEKRVPVVQPIEVPRPYPVVQIIKQPVLVPHTVQVPYPVYITREVPVNNTANNTAANKEIEIRYIDRIVYVYNNTDQTTSTSHSQPHSSTTHIQNPQNSTNIIHVTTIINNTNVNTISDIDDVTSDTSRTDTVIDSHKCCTVVAPSRCDQNRRWSCGKTRYERCGGTCRKARVVILKPRVEPTYVAIQDVFPRPIASMYPNSGCFGVSTWPYVDCRGFCSSCMAPGGSCSSSCYAEQHLQDYGYEEYENYCSTYGGPMCF